MRSNSNPVLIESLKQHVDRLAGLIGARHLGAPRSFAAAATFVESELAAAGYVTKRQPYNIGQHEVANILAELPGNRRQHEVVVVGAHYDTVSYSPGADDNASAVAVLIEVARLMRPLNPSRSVRFVSFACEEPPYFHTGDMGSQVFARQCRARGEHIHGMLCLEMLGYYTTKPHTQQLPPGIPPFLHRFMPHRGDFLAAVGNLPSWRLLWQFRRGFKHAVRFPLWTLALPESIEEIRLSDNSSFWDQGYRALMLTDTSFLRNPHYHQASDTPDTLDYERMAQVTLGIAGGAARLAGIRRPRFTLG
jgi:Zn-dependent M28 family amino/carboxypeptidase